jgi:hypothetical protein
MRTWLHAAVLAGATLIPAAARAQLTIEPLVGAYIPASDLKEVRTGASSAASTKDGTLALGANIGMGNLRLSLAYASGATIKDTDNADIGKGTTLAGALDLKIPIFPRIIVQPYILAGGGFVNTSFDPDAGAAGAFPEDSRKGAIHGGLGANLELGPIGVLAELTDFVRKDPDGKWNTHEAFLMTGLRIKF